MFKCWCGLVKSKVKGKTFCQHCENWTNVMVGTVKPEERKEKRVYVNKKSG